MSVDIQALTDMRFLTTLRVLPESYCPPSVANGDRVADYLIMPYAADALRYLVATKPNVVHQVPLGFLEWFSRSIYEAC